MFSLLTMLGSPRMLRFPRMLSFQRMLGLVRRLSFPRMLNLLGKLGLLRIPGFPRMFSLSRMILNLPGLRPPCFETARRGDGRFRGNVLSQSERDLGNLLGDVVEALGSSRTGWREQSRPPRVNVWWLSSQIEFCLKRADHDLEKPQAVRVNVDWPFE
jgi:hypothetical protein